MSPTDRRIGRNFNLQALATWNQLDQRSSAMRVANRVYEQSMDGPYGSNPGVMSKTNEALKIWKDINATCGWRSDAGR